MKSTNVIGYNIDGNVVNVAAIEIADQHLRKNLYEGAHYLLTAAREDETGTLTHYILTVIPGSKNSEMMKPRVVQNTQATADAKMARVLEEIETGIVQAPELLKFKAEKHPTDRAIAEWIVAEKTKHASIVSRAYDTGEAGSIEKYTEEVQSIVRMTLDILEGGEPENTTASVKEVRMVPYQDGLETVIYKCVLCGLHKSLTHNTVAPDRIGCPECMLVTMLKPDDPVWGGDSTNKE